MPDFEDIDAHKRATIARTKSMIDSGTKNAHQQRRGGINRKSVIEDGSGSSGSGNGYQKDRSKGAGMLKMARRSIVVQMDQDSKAKRGQDKNSAAPVGMDLAALRLRHKEEQDQQAIQDRRKGQLDGENASFDAISVCI